MALIVGALAASLPASLLCLRAPGWSAAAALPRGPTPDDGIALNLQAAPAVVVTQYEADLAGDGWTTPGGVPSNAEGIRVEREAERRAHREGDQAPI